MRNNRGVTLIELIVVIAMISIISLIAVPRFTAYSETAKLEVCRTNCRMLEKAMDLRMDMESVDYSDQLWNSVLQQTLGSTSACPNKGIIMYEQSTGRVECGYHDKNDGENDEVPYL